MKDSFSLKKENIWIVANVLNEVCHGIYIADFEKKICEKHEVVKNLLKDLTQHYEYYLRALSGREFLDNLIEDCDASNHVFIDKESLIIIENSFKAVLNEIEEWEFQTRIGVTIEETEKIIRSINVTD